MRSQILAELKDLKEQQENVVKNRTIKKLNKLYKGEVALHDNTDAFINLSKYELTPNQKRLLNLGIKCHIQPKFDQIKKKTELEVLYKSILKLENDNKIIINPNLKEQLCAEGTKRRTCKRTRLLTPELQQAAKELRENEEIIIRKADKSNIFVNIRKSLQKKEVIPQI